MVIHKKKIGEKAEIRACEFLQKQGLTFIAKNFRCRQGEIDLIMRERETIVFVEVRSRSSNNFGSAIESVNRQKQRKIFTASVFYLRQKNWLNKVNFRFDIIGICNDQLDWVKNAFIPSESTL